MASTGPVHASEADFQTVVLEATLPVVVDVWAPWCPPCRALSPFIDKFAAEFAGKIAIVKVNFDENQALAKQYGIDSIPRLLFFSKGELIDTQVGLPPYAHLKQLFDGFVLKVTGMPAQPESEAERQFVLATETADQAYDQVVEPEAAKLQATAAPIAERHKLLVDAAADELKSGAITQEEHDLRVAAADEQRDEEIKPARAAYLAVSRPALAAFVDAVQAAVELFKLASSGSGCCSGSACKAGDRDCIA